MPVFSAFTPFGQLEFSSDISDAEKMYLSLRDAFRDPKSGEVAIDVSAGTYQEAKVYGWAMALGDASRVVRSAGDELRGESSYYQLEAQEKRFGMTPGSNDTIAMRRAALAAKQKAARGPRYEAMVTALQAILGSNFVAYRPMTVDEALVYPSDPSDGPGVFPRPDAISKSIRILTAIARPGTSPSLHDRYDESNLAADTPLYAGAASTVGAAQSFVAGTQGKLRYARFHMKKVGAPTGSMHAKLYADVAGSPGGAALAVSKAVDVSTLTTTYGWIWFEFEGVNQLELTNGATYWIAVEFHGGTAVNHPIVGVDNLTLMHGGQGAYLTDNTPAADSWAADPVLDVLFEVHTEVSTRFQMEVAYENWNGSKIEEKIVKGDVLCIDPGILGAAEKVTVLAASGSGTSRTFTAEFQKQHAAGTFATTGPTPIWASTKRHVLVVVKAAAAASVETRDRIHELFQRVMRAPTTWDIVEESTPGAATVGPFVLGTSPLGAVPIDELDILPPTPPFFGPMPARGETPGGFTIRLFGEYLSNTSSVTIGGTSVAFTQVSDRELYFTAPSLPAGKKDIVVTTPLGTTTKRECFEYEQAELSITSMTPDTGPNGGGTAVVLAGTGFYKVVDLQINGFTVATWSIVDDATINFTTDAVGGPATIPVVVIADNGDTASKDFVFT